MGYLIAPINTEKRKIDPVKEARAKEALVGRQEAVPANVAQPKPVQTVPAVMEKTAAQKRDEAQQLYDAYVQSDEYKKKQEDRKTYAWMVASVNGDKGYVPEQEKDQKEQELKALVDHYTAQAQKEEDQRIMEADLQELESWDEADRAALESYIINRNMDFANRLNPMADAGFGTADQKAAALIQKYGLGKVRQMAESLERSKNAEITQVAEQAGREGADSGFFGAVGHNAASVGANVVGGLTGLMGYLQEWGQRTGRYATMDPNNIGNLPSAYAGGVREGTAQNIAGDVYDENGNLITEGGKLRQLGAYAYQSGMSAADSLARAALGGGATGGTALAATGSFARTVSEASAQGATPGEAALLATATAGIEYLTEKIPLDNLVDAAKSGGHGLKETIRKALLQGGVEVTTEEISLIVTTLAEAAILREKSGYRQRIQELVAGGVPLAEAQNTAMLELLKEAGETAIVSFLSGIMSEVGASITGNLTHQGGDLSADGQQRNTDADNPPATEKQLQEDAAPELTERDRVDQVVEETMAQLAKESPQEKPAEKDLTLERALEMTFGKEGNDQGSRADDLERLQAQEESLRGAADAYASAGDNRAAAEVEEDRQKYADQFRAVQDQETARMDGVTDQDAPAEPEAPYPGRKNTMDPFRDRSWEGVGSRKVKAYMAENPEVKPYIQQEDMVMADELANTTKGERGYNEDVHYESGGENGWWGTKRHTSEDIAELRDSGMSYEQIDKGLSDIIEDHGKENSAAAKRVEIQLNDRLRNGYKSFMTGKQVQPNQEYIYAVNEAEANRAGQESFNALVNDADNYAPPAQDAEASAQRADGQDTSTIRSRENSSPTYEELVKKEDVPVIDVRNSKKKTYQEMKEDVFNMASFGKWYVDPKINADTGMPVFLSKATFTHAFSNLTAEHGEDTILAAANAPKLIENAVLVNTAPPKDPQKAESKVHTFLAAIRTERGVAPVKITVKEYDVKRENRLPQNILAYFKRTKAASQYHKAYDLEALEVMDVETTKKELGASADAIGSHGRPTENSTPNSTIRVSDLMGLVKGKDEKYIPKPIVKGTGAAEQNFSGKPAYNATLSEDNAQPDRADDVRPMELPERDMNGGDVSAVTGNVYGSKITPDSLASLMEERVAKGDFSYAKITNDRATQMATETIARARTWENAYDSWKQSVTAGNAGAEMSARGALLLNYAAQKGDKRQWIETLHYMQRLGTNTAQGLQALRIIRTLNAPDKVEFTRMTVQKMVEEMKLGVGVEIDEALLQRYENATTDEDRDSIMAEIQQNVADQIPSTFLDKFTALRYVNMLGNLKTTLARNTLGNLAMKGAYKAKDTVAAGVEELLSAASGGKFQRTKSLTVSSELRKACKADFAQYAGIVSDGGKFGDSQTVAGDFAKGVMEKRRIFKGDVRTGNEKFDKAANKVLDVAMAPAEGYRKATNWMMNNKYFGDEAFGRGAYARAMAGYLKANGVKDADLSKVDDALLDKARAYAIQEAQEATFHDNTTLARIVQKGQKTFGIVGEGIMPFTKTPANILVRAEEFSPLGLINSTVKSLQSAAGNTKLAEKNGRLGQWAKAGREITGSDIVNSWAKTFTGTALFALGAIMKDQGWLTASADDDEDKAAFDKLNGEQEYAIVLPDGTSYTLDWLGPSVMPMFMGAELALAIEEAGGLDELTWADWENILTSVSDPMLQMSMLSGLNDSLDNIKYSDNSLAQFCINAAVSYLTQGLGNTLLGQMEKSTEEVRTQTYIDKDSQIPVWMQKQMGSLSQKIPGWDYQQTPYIDARGQEQAQPTDFGGWLYNLVSPGYLDKKEVDSVSEELYRLNETGAAESNVFLDSPSTTVSYTDKDGVTHKDYNLTAEEADTLKRVTGQTSVETLKGLFESETYKAMTDQQKAKTVELAYDYAREKGRTAALEGYEGLDGWMKGIQGNEVDGILDKAVKGAFTDAFDQLATDPEGAAAALDQAYDLLDPDNRLAWAQEAGSKEEAFIMAKARKIDTGTFAGLYQQYKEIGKDKSLSNTQKAQEWADALQKAQESGKLTKAQKEGLKKDLIFYNQIPAGSAKYDTMTDQGMDSDSADYITGLLDGIKDNSQKLEKIASSDLRGKDLDIAMKAYMDDYDPEAKNPDYTEVKYDYIRQELGYSAKDYTAARRINAADGKKAQKIAEMRDELGITDAQARELYGILNLSKRGKAEMLDWYKELYG